LTFVTRLDAPRGREPRLGQATEGFIAEPEALPNAFGAPLDVKLARLDDLLKG
jgi:hypothetical protein